MQVSSDSSYVATYGCTLCSELLLTPKLLTIMEPPKIDTLKRTLACKPHSHLYSKMHLGQNFMPFLMSNFCAHSHPHCGLAIIKAMAPARRGVCARVRSAHKVRSMRTRRRTRDARLAGDRGSGANRNTARLRKPPGFPITRRYADLLAAGARSG